MPSGSGRKNACNQEGQIIQVAAFQKGRDEMTTGRVAVVSRTTVLSSSRYYPEVVHALYNTVVYPT